MAEPQARGDSVASVVVSMSVAWQAREVVTWPKTVAAKPGAVAELMSQSGQTPWYKVLELNVATATMADEVVQRCKDTLTQQMSVTLRGCVPSAVAKAMSDASKSKGETMIGRPTKQLETERTGRANAEAQLDNERKRVRELENESIKKQLAESNTKTVEAKQQADQLLAVMAGNYKNA